MDTQSQEERFAMMREPGFERLCSDIFTHLDDQMKKRSEIGFWTIGRPTGGLITKEVNPAFGAWYAEAELPERNAHAGISVAITPGETRIGLILPVDIVMSPSGSLEKNIATALTGSEPSKSVAIGDDRWLFDYFFSADPFSAQWIVDAQSDGRKAEALALRLGYLVATLWKGAAQIILQNANHETFRTFSLRTYRALSTHDISAAAEGAPLRVTRADMRDGTFIVFVETTLTETGMQQVVERLGPGVDLLDIETNVAA